MKKLIRLLTLLVIVTTSASLMAANQIVTNNNDSGAGSLRQAIADVGDGETITFNIAGSDIVTITSELSISAKGITINGYNNATGDNITVQVTTPGTSAWRVFNINASGKTTNISNMTIKGGNVESIGTLVKDGGSILVDYGTLYLENIEITGSKGMGGGAIRMDHSSSLYMNKCLIYSCTATLSSGGAIYSSGDSQTLEILNSTIANNSAPGEGATSGAIDFGSGSLIVANSTITGNSAEYGGGILVWYGDVKILNSIIINNSAPSGGNDLYNYEGAINSYYSWYNGTTGTIGGSNNNTTAYTSGDLSAIAYKGGFTKTCAVSSAGNASTKAGSGVRTGIYDDGGTTKYAFWDGAEWKQLTSPTTSATGVTEITTDQRGYYRTSSAITRGAYQYDGVVAKNGGATSWTGSSDVYTTIEAAYDAASTGNTILLAETPILESGINLDESKTITT